MPIRNPATCKFILDNGGAGKAAAESATTMMLAVGANILEGTVADGAAGEAWLADVKAEYTKFAERNERFAAKFKDLCMSQPVA